MVLEGSTVRTLLLRNEYDRWVMGFVVHCADCSSVTRYCIVHMF